MNLAKIYESSLEPVVLAEKNEEKMAQRKAGTVPYWKSGHLFRIGTKNCWVLCLSCEVCIFPNTCHETFP